MSGSKIEFTIMNHGFEEQASYSYALIEYDLKPLLREWRTMTATDHRRILVALAAPCGAGKTTLSACLEELTKQDPSLGSLQALGMDGFHYRQSYILEHRVIRDGIEVPMKQVKGCPESFDFCKFKRYVQSIKKENLVWPMYDRTIHDVTENGKLVSAEVVLIEGNYVLLDQDGWRELSKEFDVTIFMDAPWKELRQRLIKRKMLGGMAPHEALAFCERSDLYNARLIKQCRLPADHEFVWNDHQLTRIK